MNIDEVIGRLGKHIQEFEEKKDLNKARKAAEAFCKIILLNSKTPGASDKANETNLNKLIESLNKNSTGIVENHINRIKADLRIIQTIGNLDSHDNEEFINSGDFDRIFMAINNLVKLVFDSKDKIYIDKKIPKEIFCKIHKSIIENENWRCEKILSIVYPNRKIFKREISRDFEFYGIDDADQRKIGVLFLARNISFKQTFEIVFGLGEIPTLSSLTFLFPTEISEATGTPVKNRKENIERISKDFTSRFPKLKFSYEFIENYIWDRCLPDSAKEITDPPHEPYFIDQNLSSSSINMLGLEFVDSLVKNRIKEKKPIYLIFGDGGAGKTTFCDQAIQLINSYQNQGFKKKAILISSYDVPDESSTSMDSMGSIDSLQALYSLIADGDTDIDSQSLGLNISSGNVLVIIDGLDEIQSKLKERFELDKFIESVQELNDTYQNCSVLITSRQIYSRAFDNSDIHIFYINGFDNDLIDKYLKKRFKGNPSSQKIIHQAKCYIEELGSNSQVTPLIIRLACDLADDDGSEKKPVLNSAYFKLSEPLDKIVYQLMDREIGKQFLGIKTCDQYFEIMRDIIFQYNGQVNENELFDLVSFALAGTGIDYESGISKNYYTSTLLSRKKDIFSVKYDSLEFWVKVRYLTFLINEKESEKDVNIVRELSKSCYSGGAMVTEICKHKNKASSYESKVILDYSASLNESSNEEMVRKLISALLYINLNGSSGDRKDNSQRIIELFSIKEGYEVVNISIYGEFYPLDFSVFKVRGGYFNGFSSLARSNIPENQVVFYASTFRGFDKSVFGTRTLSWNNFDSQCVLDDEFRDLISLSGESHEKRRDYIIGDLKKIIKVGYKRGVFLWKSESVYKQQCASLKSKLGLSSIIEILIAEDILEKESSKGSSGIGFKVKSNFSLEGKDFLTQSIVAEKLENVISKLMN